MSPQTFLMNILDVLYIFNQPETTPQKLKGINPIGLSAPWDNSYLNN